MRKSRQVNQNTQGILCLVVALVFLTISDSIIKWLSPVYPLYEIMFFRAVVALALVLGFTYFVGGLSQLRTRRPGLHFLRGFLLVLANAFFFLGLSTMPLATVVTLFYSAPLFICLVAKPILGESVGLFRWLAIFVGMIGVVIMANPGSTEFTWSVFLPVLAALTYSMVVMMTRKLGISDSASTLAFYIQISFLLVGAVNGLLIGHGKFNVFDQTALDFLLRAWQWPGVTDIQLIFWCGIASAVGAYLLSQSYRLAEASLVAPFEYTSLPFAIAVGFVVWGDLPGVREYIGSALIITSGLVVIYFDARLRQTASISNN